MKQLSAVQNLSIIMPGQCNANCNFCFWRSDKEPQDYIQQLKATLDSMPEEFAQISLTGGEPCISPYFRDVLNVIDKKRYPKVVLTTNGTSLIKQLVCPEFAKVDHLNISRHHFDDAINNEIFNS